MKHTVIAILAVVSLASEVRAQQPAPIEALDGVDPVLLVQGKEASNGDFGPRPSPRLTSSPEK